MSWRGAVGWFGFRGRMQLVQNVRQRTTASARDVDKDARRSRGQRGAAGAGGFFGEDTDKDFGEDFDKVSDKDCEPGGWGQARGSLGAPWFNGPPWWRCRRVCRR